MDIRRLLTLQIIYLFIAVAYNVLSIWLINTRDIGLIDGRDPTQSILSLLLLVPVIYFGFLGWNRAYLLINTALMLLIAYGGIITHLLFYWDGDLSRYSSIWAWTSAVAINVFGVAVGLTASYMSWGRVSTKA